MENLHRKSVILTSLCLAFLVLFKQFGVKDSKRIVNSHDNELHCKRRSADSPAPPSLGDELAVYLLVQ